MTIVKLDEHLWIVKTNGNTARYPCCFESHEAASLAQSLRDFDRRNLQKRAGARVITYHEVFRTLAGRVCKRTASHV